MHVLIASLNPVKIGAVEDAFALFVPHPDCRFEGISVSSGVSDQPLSDKETWQGAHNRVTATAAAHPTADYCVGLEGGIDTLHGQISTFAWIVIRRQDGRTSQSRSTSLPLPKCITALIDQGLELGHACDRVFNTDNAKQKGGAIGLLTRDNYTRRSTYTQTVCFALAGLEDAPGQDSIP